MITQLAISGYRSLRDAKLSLEPLNIVTGANGSGKSNLYRALWLLAGVVQGRIVTSLALECGISSTLWAGPERFSRAMKSGEQPGAGDTPDRAGQPEVALLARVMATRSTLAFPCSEETPTWEPSR